MWLSSCILTALRFPLIANLIFFWEIDKGSGVGGGVGEIIRGKLVPFYIPRLPNVSTAYLRICIYIYKTLERHVLNINNSVIIYLGGKIMVILIFL